MSDRPWKHLAAQVFILGLSLPLLAGPVPIENHSFEADILPRDGNTGTSGSGSDDYDTNIVPTGWTGFDDGRGSGGNRGLVSTAPDSFFNATLAPTPADDANDQTFFTAARDLYQVLTANLEAQTTYTLQVDIGDRNAGGAAGNPGTPIIHFGTGITPGQNILPAMASNTPAQVNGGWVTWTFSYTTEDMPAGLGEALRIELTTGTNVGWFDNLRLDSSPAPPPLKLSLGRAGADIHFSWPGQAGRVYDLLIDNGNFGMTTRDGWPAYMNSEGIIATPPVNALTLPAPAGIPGAYFALASRPAAANGTVKVLLLGGQSNMLGSGTVVSDLPAHLQASQEDVLFFYSGNASLTTLQPGSGGAYGPELSLGRALADADTNTTYALIKYAVGGTDLENQWDPVSGANYAAFRSVVADGLAALQAAEYDIDIVGMCWCQGERDARQGFGSTYEANLNAFIADVRARYGTNLPFFISQLSALQTNLPAVGLDQVRQAQANVAAADPNSYLIVTDSFDMRTENLHFSGTGQVSLGQGFADAILALP